MADVDYQQVLRYRPTEMYQIVRLLKLVFASAVAVVVAVAVAAAVDVFVAVAVDVAVAVVTVDVVTVAVEDLVCIDFGNSNLQNKNRLTETASCSR